MCSEKDITTMRQTSHQRDNMTCWKQARAKTCFAGHSKSTPAEPLLPDPIFESIERDITRDYTGARRVEIIPETTPPPSPSHKKFILESSALNLSNTATSIFENPQHTWYNTNTRVGSQHGNVMYDVSPGSPNLWLLRRIGGAQSRPIFVTLASIRAFVAQLMSPWNRTPTKIEFESHVLSRYHSAGHLHTTLKNYRLIHYETGQAKKHRFHLVHARDAIEFFNSKWNIFRREFTSATSVIADPFLISAIIYASAFYDENIVIHDNTGPVTTPFDANEMRDIRSISLAPNTALLTKDEEHAIFSILTLTHRRQNDHSPVSVFKRQHAKRKSITPPYHAMRAFIERMER